MFIRKAERKQAKLRLALCGVSGSGKTLGALKIAKGMGGRTVVIDTENHSADLYAHISEYDVLELEAPFSPKRYCEAIAMCEKSGYSNIIIDSLSHGWAGSGGVLEMVDNITKSSNSKNSYFAWSEGSQQQNKLLESILQSKCHIIVTLRSKTHYEIVDQGGKKVPVKMGLAPVQRSELDYEFTVVLDLEKQSHFYTASKDRTGIFDNKHDELSEKTGIELLSWLSQGIDEEIIKSELLTRYELFQNMSELQAAYSRDIKSNPQLESFIKKLATDTKSRLSETPRAKMDAAKQEAIAAMGITQTGKSINESPPI